MTELTNNPNKLNENESFIYKYNIFGNRFKIMVDFFKQYPLKATIGLIIALIIIVLIILLRKSTINHNNSIITSIKGIFYKPHQIL